MGEEVENVYAAGGPSFFSFDGFGFHVMYGGDQAKVVAINIKHDCLLSAGNLDFVCVRKCFANILELCPQGLARKSRPTFEHFAGLRVALNELLEATLFDDPHGYNCTRRFRGDQSTVQRCVAMALNLFGFGRGLKFGELFFEVFDAFGEFGELDELEVDAAGVGGFHGGGAADFDVGGFGVHHDAGLGGDTDHVGDVEVTGDADLASHDDVFAGGGGSGDADLGDEEVSGADLAVVSDDDGVAEFGAFADGGGFEDGAFDDGVAADFDIVFDEDVSSLGDFVVDAGVGGEAVAVGADDGAGVEDAAVADFALFVDGDVGVEDRVGADGDVVHEGDVRINVRVVADGDVFGDDGEGVDVDVIADFGGGVDRGLGGDADGRVSALAVEFDEGLLPGEVGVFDFDGGERGEAFGALDGFGGSGGEEDDAGLGGGELAGVFFVVEEGDLAFGGAREGVAGRDGAGGVGGGTGGCGEGSLEKLGEVGDGDGGGLWGFPKDVMARTGQRKGAGD